jgi:hypothetical protein
MKWCACSALNALDRGMGENNGFSGAHHVLRRPDGRCSLQPPRSPRPLPGAH